MVIIFSSPPFYTNHVSLPTGAEPISPQICNNPKFWPYFKNAIGAIDGSHIPCAPPANHRPFFCNHKGFISMNCLFACNFALKFIYALTGWEGSAHTIYFHLSSMASTPPLHTPQLNSDYTRKEDITELWKRSSTLWEV